MIAVPCNLCGADDFEVRYPATLNERETAGLNVDAFSCTNPGYGQHAQIVNCRRCGHVYANPRWPGDEIMDAYEAVEDETYVRERIGRELTFQRHLAHMERFVGPANGRSLLDIGAYIGVFVSIAQAAGWQATGVEPSQWAAEVARRQGLPVINGTQTSPELVANGYDVVTMWDVIEHVADPKKEVADARRLLKPGGWLVIHTMNIDSLAARLLGRRWPWFMDMHLHYFSAASLARLLEQGGYQVVWSGARGRYLRLGYVASRVAAINATVGRVTQRLVDTLGLARRAIPINFGDLFTVYAQLLPEETPGA